LWTRVEDLALWDQNFYDHTVGGEALARDQLLRGRLTNGDTISYASGLMLGEHRGLPTVSHGGAFMGYRTELLRFPTQHFSVICLCNLSTSNPSARAERVADVLLSGVYPKTVAAAPVTPQATGTVDVSVVRGLAGAYRSPESGMVFDLVIKGQALAIRLFGQDFALRPLSATELRDSGGPVPISVRVVPGASAGKAATLQLSIAGAPAESYERYERRAIASARLADYVGR